VGGVHIPKNDTGDCGQSDADAKDIAHRMQLDAARSFGGRYLLRLVDVHGVDPCGFMVGSCDVVRGSATGLFFSGWPGICSGPTTASDLPGMRTCVDCFAVIGSPEIDNNLRG
jgi:hypothetical protein